MQTIGKASALSHHRKPITSPADVTAAGIFSPDAENEVAKYINMII